MAKRKGDGKRNRPKTSLNKQSKKQQRRNQADSRLQRAARVMHQTGPGYVNRGQSKKSRQKKRKKLKLWRDRQGNVSTAVQQVEKLLCAKLNYQRSYAYAPSNQYYYGVKAGATEAHVYTVNTNRAPRLPNGASPFNVKTLYHGTSLRNLASILKDGKLTPSWGGLLGPGIYVGKFGKASIFARSHDDIIAGVVLECSVACGREYMSPRYFRSSLPEGYHSKVGRAGRTVTYGNATLNNDEWAIPNPCQVVIKAVHLICRPSLEEE